MNVKVARTIRGFTQSELAEKSNVCRTIISKIRLDAMKRIATALDMSVEELFLKDEGGNVSD